MEELLPYVFASPVLIIGLVLVGVEVWKRFRDR